MHAKATVDGTVVAETDNYEVVEGNIYFPPSAIEAYKDVYSPTETTTHCPWKGEASYYTLNVNGKEIKDGAWYYPTPSAKAKNIKDYVAFYKTKVKVDSS